MRHPSTTAKRQFAHRTRLHSLPYAISNWLRRIENRILSGKPAKAPAKPAAVQAQGLHHVLVMDDVVDSGATLACVVGALQAALPADTI